MAALSGKRQEVAVVVSYMSIFMYLLAISRSPAKATDML